MELDTPATERIEARKNGLRTGLRGVRSLPTIRMEGIERPHRKENHLRYKWMYRKRWFVSNSTLAGPYCGTLWTNHESGENVNLDHDTIKRAAKAHQSIKQKDGFEKSSFSMV
jgi:hypothetical protein